uniref:Aerolysin-like C-terminal domain-containing protein n=1 Tax=Biomphalaria glabrata TaxID=6526 RepID=A0A182YTK7_BIOGL
MLYQIFVVVSLMPYVRSQCSYSNWLLSFDKPGQSKCDQINYYINALFRDYVNRNYDPISLLEGVQCCQPNSPWYSVEQQVVFEDWTTILDRTNEWAFCRVGYFLQGLYRSSSGYISAIEGARCTKPANHPLNYGDCTDLDIANCMAQVGLCSCPGGYFLTGLYRSDGNNLSYLKKIKCCTPADKPLDLDEKSKIQTHIMDTTLWNGFLSQFLSPPQHTITHTTTSTFTNSHELGISLNFDIGVVSGGTSYTFKYESSKTTTKENSVSQTAGFTKTSSITLGPGEAAKYKVILSKSRTTIPYTAVVTTKVSTEMKGFLRWEDGNGNFHQIYRTNRNRPTFNYRFGDASVSFFEALKKQSVNKEGPWMWGMLFQKFPIARHVIDRLTDESQYQFSLTGKLEKVEGTHIYIEWEKIPQGLRDVSRDEAPASNITTYIAAPGPADNPAIVEYPKVDIKSKVPFEPFQIPITSV